MKQILKTIFLFLSKTPSFILISYSVLISSIVYLLYVYIKKSEEVLDLKNKYEIIMLHNQSLHQSLKQTSGLEKTTSDIAGLPAYSVYTYPLVILGVIVGVLGVCVIIYLYCNGGGSFPAGVGGGDTGSNGILSVYGITLDINTVIDDIVRYSCILFKKVPLEDVVSAVDKIKDGLG